MNDDRDWLDELLRAGRATAVADDGFANKVISRLPARVAAAPRWLLPLALALGVLSAGVASNAGGHVISAVQLLLVNHQISVIGLLPILLIWASCAWALSESR